MIPDSALLRQYVEKDDETAFAELVRRHIDLVYSVALRQANGDAHLAEDATQAVFVDLARKARSLCGRDTLAGWLHTSARFAAGNAIRGEARRRVREHEAVTMQEITSAPDLNWDHLRPLLDESVGQLKEADRDAIVLRFFEGKSHEEIGQILGLSENSANKRVERALDKLRELFARRGVTASSALLATAMAENSVQAAPVGLAAQVTGPSLAAAEITTGGLFLKILFMSTKTKLLTAAVILVIAVIVTLNWPQTIQPPSLPSLTATGSSVAPRQSELVVAAQVAPPVLPAVKPSASSASADAALPAAPIPAAAGDQAPFVAGPQADLNAAVAAGIYYAKSQDLVGYAKTLVPPDVLAEPLKIMPLEEFAVKAAESPETAQGAANMLEILTSIQNKTPSLNDDGTRASYSIDPPVDGHKVITFNKIGGFWYLGGDIWLSRSLP